MIEILVTLIVTLLGLLLLAQVYFLLLQARYPEPTHADEIYTVTTSDGWSLRLYRRIPASGVGEPVFFMHSLASNHLNFEVPHGYSLVDYLLKAGYDCWTFDSRACRNAIPPRRSMRYASTVDDILLKDIPPALQTIRAVTGHDRVHWIGHSMGGMLLYAYDATFQTNEIASGVTLGSPPGFKGYEHFSHRTLIQLDRIAYPILDRVFRGLAPYYHVWHPKSRLVPINWDNVHPKFRTKEIFHAIEMPLPGIGEQMDQWASGKPWTVNGGKVNVESHLSKLRFPLLAIFGGIDPFISQQRAQAFVNAIENPDKKIIIRSRALGDSANYNHIELPFAIEAEKEIFEPILDWLDTHPAGATTKPKRARSKRAAKPSSPPPASNVHLSSASTPARKRTAAKKTAAAKKKTASKKKERPA